MAGLEMRLGEILETRVDLSDRHMLRAGTVRASGKHSLPFRESSLSLRDISEAIEMIEAHFRHGFRCLSEKIENIAAVERKLSFIKRGPP